jgi:hypothetical protein
MLFQNTFQEIDDTVEKAMYANSSVQNKLLKKESHCSKYGEWLECHSEICGECGEISK